jgi:8-amino-3,8-dideoxy-alpha-D-manno-octulosonate transaminase
MPGFEIFGEDERREVTEVLDTGVLFRYGFEQARKGRWKARNFERMLSEKIGATYCHACSSGTAALAVALASCGIGAGDEVIVPPFTFIATIEAVLHSGALPVFSEIDETLCLNPDKLEKVLTSRTKGVIAVHMCGAMARIDAVKDFCKMRGLFLIEDACQALGASFAGKHLGTFGQMGCFSFDAVKTVTCGEGGAVVTDDRELYVRADAYSDHGHDHLGNDRGLEDHPILGFNYRISELNAAVGLGQLKKLDHMLSIQKENKAYLKDALKDCKDISFRDLPDETGDSATFLSFFLADKGMAMSVFKKMTASGVDGLFYWYENNWHYIRRWFHLKNMATAARLPVTLLGNFPDFRSVSLPESDRIMGKTLSMLIKLSWSQMDLRKRAQDMVAAFNP